VELPPADKRKGSQASPILLRDAARRRAEYKNRADELKSLAESMKPGQRRAMVLAIASNFRRMADVSAKRGSPS
jgi:hypothetical protein